MGRLDSKVAVVTGGGNGIGRACCERFAAEGADVVVADLLEASGREVVAAVEALGRRAVFHQLDATSPSDNEDAMQRAIDELGRLDVLVTSSGISSKGYVSDGDTQAAVGRMATSPAATNRPTGPMRGRSSGDMVRPPSR